MITAACRPEVSFKIIIEGHFIAPVLKQQQSFRVVCASAIVQACRENSTGASLTLQGPAQPGAQQNEHRQADAHPKVRARRNLDEQRPGANKALCNTTVGATGLLGQVPQSSCSTTHATNHSLQATADSQQIHSRFAAADSQQ